MTFNSLQFLAFFIAVLVVYYRLGRDGQNRLMVLAAAVFYGAFDWRFLFLLAASTLVDYGVGRGLDATDDIRRRRALLATSLTFQLGILGFFKYFNFFTSSAASALHRFGLRGDFVTIHVLLPVGISFYTFQTLAYVFAVYRRQWKAERNLVVFATFVSWFPTLLAGPIERAPALLPQIKRRRDPPSGRAVESGLLLILMGLVKKVVIADALATYVDSVYAQPHTYGWATLVLASVGFAVEVYGDFAGYSDIARGVSRLLGVELMRNFEQPFLSRDIRELWQRWHTSLASWFVDFVGQPLGGARQGRWRTALNVMIIFALIGLWHGPAWHFVVWGLFNGALIVIWRAFFPVSKRRHPMKLRLGEIPAIALTFVLFAAGAVFFRAASIHDAGVVFERILLLRPGVWGGSSAALVPIMLTFAVVLDLVERRARIRTIETLRIRARLGAEASPAEAAHETLFVGMGVLPAGALLGLLSVALIVFSGGKPVPFIYFHF